MGNDPPVGMQEAFERFERETVRVADEEIAVAKAVHREIRDHIASGVDDVTRTFLVGSYARRTQAGKLKDIDIAIEMSLQRGARPASEALVDLAAVAQHHPRVASVQMGARAVTLDLHLEPPCIFTLDLVPVLPRHGRGMLLARRFPEDGLDDWSVAYPEEQIAAAKERSDEVGPFYRQFVRLVKYWNGGYAKEKRPLGSSYYAESIAWHAIRQREPFAEALVRYLDDACTFLAPGAPLADPGSGVSDVFERLEPRRRLVMRKAVDSARREAHAALHLGDSEEALVAWQRFFNEGLGAATGAVEKLRAALTAGTATAVGAGVSATASGRPIARSRSWRP